jgi:hypothetical protein
MWHRHFCLCSLLELRKRSSRLPRRTNAERRPDGEKKEVGAPSMIRTCDLQLRRLSLYPAELWAPGNGEANCTRKSQGTGHGLHSGGDQAHRANARGPAHAIDRNVRPIQHAPPKRRRELVLLDNALVIHGWGSSGSGDRRARAVHRARSRRGRGRGRATSRSDRAGGASVRGCCRRDPRGRARAAICAAGVCRRALRCGAALRSVTGVVGRGGPVRAGRSLVAVAGGQECHRQDNLRQQLRELRNRNSGFLFQHGSCPANVAPAHSPMVGSA